MPFDQLGAAVVGFAIVMGFTGLMVRRWRGRSSYQDDASILLPAPPTEMTPATAAIVTGAPTRVAFTTALLDLASRDEIAFTAEGTTQGVADVGIAIHGGTSADPRVLLNRRRAAGEGELWLLGRLKLAAEMPGGLRAGLADMALGEGPSPALLQTGMSLLGAMLRTNALAPGDDLGQAAIEAREHGLLSSGPPDATALAHALEMKTGHPLLPGGAKQLGAVAALFPLLADPAAMARDPDAYSQAVERALGRPLTPEEHAKLERGIAQYVARVAPATEIAQAAQTGPPSGPEYIAAAQARSLSAPFFGTFVQTYARRHGWLRRMPMAIGDRSRVIGIVAFVVGAALVSMNTGPNVDLIRAMGLGVIGGGIVTYFFAPSMVPPTAEGGRMVAVLAAYRRTLQLSFNSAASIGDVVRPTGLPWLETPDQALVWGMGLGLHAEIEALLARSENGTGVGSGAASPYVPSGFGSTAESGATGDARGASAAAPSVAAMFAGIEAIGTGAGH